jgi:hypothetical protein
MADLGNCGTTLTEQLAVDQAATSDTCAHGDIKHASPTAPRTGNRFGQRCQIAIVSQKGRNAKRLQTPRTQWEIHPTVDLMTANRPSVPGIHGSSKSDADSLHAILSRQLLAHFRNLLEDSAGSLFGSHFQLAERNKLNTAARADAQLQFRAADFNAEEHDA